MNAPFPSPSLRLHRRKNPREQAANTLIVTVAFLATVSALLGVTLSVTGSSSQNTRRSAQYIAARSAAEGAVEYAYAVWLKRTLGSPITTVEANKNLTPPEFEGVTYAQDGGVQLRIDALNEYGVPVSTGAAPVTGRVPGYEGWSGRTFTYAAQARVQIDDKTVVGVRRLFQYTEVPLFQSMFFFQDDLEFYRPATMVLNGLIHSNSTMYLAPSDNTSLTIKGNATYTNGVTAEEPPTAKYWTDGYVKNRGNPLPTPIWTQSEKAQLHKVPPIQPMGGDPEKVFDKDNPNADGFWQLVAPANPNLEEKEAIQTRRLINKAGIVIEINGADLTATNAVKVTAQNGTVISNKKKLADTLKKTISTDEIKDKKGKVTQAAKGIYDTRESTRVDAVEVDIGELVKAMTGNVSGFNNVLYIHDVTPKTENNNNPKAIRLNNGSSLPANGLTIASQNPVYVLGDYNTGGTGTNVPSNFVRTTKTKDDIKEPTVPGDYTRRPAAIIADAVVFLSNNWNDNNSSKALSSRTAANTTYNVAILAGFMLSKNTDKEKNYSGGANNFPRFLENWTNYYCTYYGSMVQLFESRVFTGKWDTGEIYKPPIRHWNFDTNYLTKPPPGSVEAIVLSRGPWSTF